MRENGRFWIVMTPRSTSEGLSTGDPAIFAVMGDSRKLFGSHFVQVEKPAINEGTLNFPPAINHGDFTVESGSLKIGRDWSGEENSIIPNAVPIATCQGKDDAVEYAWGLSIITMAYLNNLKSKTRKLETTQDDQIVELGLDASGSQFNKWQYTRKHFVQWYFRNSAESGESRCAQIMERGADTEEGIKCSYKVMKNSVDLETLLNDGPVATTATVGGLITAKINCVQHGVSINSDVKCHSVVVICGYGTISDAAETPKGPSSPPKGGSLAVYVGVGVGCVVVLFIMILMYTSSIGQADHYQSLAG